jgi:hypothetical protein
LRRDGATNPRRPHVEIVAGFVIGMMFSAQTLRVRSRKSRYPPFAKSCADTGGRAGPMIWGQDFMKSIRPDNTTPIPLRPTSPHGVGTLIIRFFGLLFLAVAALALLYSR